MGGIKSVGVVVDCDRCGKEIPVNDGNQADFYRAHAEREAMDVRMFIAILNDANGETKGIDYEYLCPKCCDAVFSYLTKIDTSLAPKTAPKDPPPAGSSKDLPQVDPPQNPPTNGGKKNKKEPKLVVKDERSTETPPPAEPEPEPAEPEPAPSSPRPGADFTDDDLFT
jgi:hypothetical protein